MLQGIFWLHDLLPDLSDDFQGLVMARSKLADETVTGVSTVLTHDAARRMDGP